MFLPSDKERFNEVYQRISGRKISPTSPYRIRHFFGNSIPESMTIQVAQTGPYTVVVLKDSVTGREYKDQTVSVAGVAKRNPVDSPNPLVGEDLAFARALRELAQYYTPIYN